MKGAHRAGVPGRFIDLSHLLCWRVPARQIVRTRRRRREGKRMCCCQRGPKWRRGVAAVGTVSRVSSASGAGASHGAAVAAAVGVGVVRVAAWTFMTGTGVAE